MQHSYTKIGMHRNVKRLWLEGLKLAACGFEKGAKFNLVYNLDNSTIEIVKDDNGTRTISGRKSGDKITPILDVCSADLVQVIGESERVRVDFTAGRIVVSIHHLVRKQNTRENNFKNNIQQGVIREGSLCAGIGMATDAIHNGLADENVKSTVEWIVDRERKYLQVAVDNNPSVKDAIIFEASLEEIEPQLLNPVDIMQVSLPCTGHSIAGKSKNKIKAAEEHKTDATAVFGLMNIIQGVNPAVIVSENVKEAQDSTTYILIKAQLETMGYNIHEIILDEKQAGSFENRKRYWFIAVSSGIDSLDVEKIINYEKQYNVLGELLEPEENTAHMWSDNQYLKDKAISDKKAGKGFARNLVNETSESVATIGRYYNKRRSTEPMLVNAEGKERLLTPVEHCRVKGAPEYFVEGVATTTAHEGLGQGIAYNQGRAIGQLISTLKGE